MRTPQRVSAFVASQVSRREFLRRTSTMSLGMILAPLGVNRHNDTIDPATIKHVRDGKPTVLSAAEVVALGLPLSLPDNKFPNGPDCPCDCSWGCQWIRVGHCYTACGQCVWCFIGLYGCVSGGQQDVYDYYECRDCCSDVCQWKCENHSCGTCCCM
jgi:hypothetical protein